jgi:lysophospholipid acyltransferase (LPLAT)-like uncharacterized protein
MARAAHVPLIPVGYQARRARFHARRWDHWLMVRPFDTLVVRYGTPLYFETDEPLQEALERVANGLAEVADSRAVPLPEARDEGPAAHAGKKEAARHPRGTPDR